MLIIKVKNVRKRSGSRHGSMEHSAKSQMEGRWEVKTKDLLCPYAKTMDTDNSVLKAWQNGRWEKELEGGRSTGEKRILSNLVCSRIAVGRT